MTAKYQTAPGPSDRMPLGIPFIVGNEAAERFSFYGMRTILVIFMTKYLLGSDGKPDLMSEEEATKYFHYFVMSAYFFPVIGSVLSDAFLGKYRTILLLSIVYCLGHLALAVDETRLGLFLGLSLIAVGSGGIKPCVSAHVGDQFGEANKHLLNKVFGWFYFSINLGAFASTLLTPVLLNLYGPKIAFGVPGVLMFLATIVFWMGRNRFVHIPAGGVEFLKEAFSKEGLLAVLKLIPIYALVAMFWSLFDQTGSSWVFQATRMNLRLPGSQSVLVLIQPWIDAGYYFPQWAEAALRDGLLPSQIQAVNPVLVLLFIPLFTYGIYPLINRVFPLTPLRKMSIGFFVAVASFAICAMIETWISSGKTPGVIWQFLAYAVITAAEIMISITCLEFSYTQAPRKIKSLVMALFMLSVAGGNFFTALVNEFIQRPDGTSRLEGPAYFWFFTGTMFVSALLFIVVAKLYRGQTYIQNEQTSEDGPDV